MGAAAEAFAGAAAAPGVAGACPGSGAEGGLGGAHEASASAEKRQAEERRMRGRYSIAAPREGEIPLRPAPVIKTEEAPRSAALGSRGRERLGEERTRVDILAPTRDRRAMTHSSYELYYWPTIQGRGEFVRLAFEKAGASYVDVARLPASEGGGVEAMLKVMRRKEAGLEPFAPPFLKVGDMLIGQTANILHYLAPRLGLVPEDEAHRIHALQLQLTIADWVSEVHDTHHPVSGELYYEDQKAEARVRAESFLGHRVPKFLDYFERVLQHNDRRHLIGSSITYVDLSMFQMMSGLGYAFPKAMARLEARAPGLVSLRDRVAELPHIAKYLASSRRLPFNEDGLFRHYPELDITPK